MKGCLKIRSRTPSPGQSRCPTPPTTPGISKKVAFTTGVSAHDVHTADEWDRTPIEPAKPLSYEDILELKEIQNSLPRAQQRPDFYASTRTKQYLLGVPVALLPIYADSSSGSASSPTLSSPLPGGASSPISPTTPRSSSSICTTTTTSSSSTGATTPSADWSTINFRAPNKSKPNPSCSKPFVPPAPNPTPIASPWTPPHLAHLAPRSSIAPTLNSTPRPPAPQRPKPAFSFVPLVDNVASGPSRSPSSTASGSTSAPPSPFLALNAGPSSPASGSPASPTTRPLFGPSSNGGTTGRTSNQRIDSSPPSIPTSSPTASSSSTVSPFPSIPRTTSSPPRPSRPFTSPFPPSPTTATATSNPRSRPPYGYTRGHHTDTDTETETETESETDPPTPSLTSRVLGGGGSKVAVLGVDPPMHLMLHSKSSQQQQQQQQGKSSSLLFGTRGGLGANPPGVLGLAGPGPTRKRRFIVVNDMEIDLGDEDEQEEEEGTALSEARAYNERMMRLYDY